MDDLEICKRIAEIEGMLISNHSIDIDDLWVHTCNFKDSSVTFFNPLTDDALCFQLMVKYKVQIGHENPDYMFAQCEYNAIKYSNTNKPNKAICLAIIESHKDL